MEIILIGAGRYGNGLIGKKYSKGEYYGAKLGAVVDPNIENIKKQDNYSFKNIETFDSFSKVPVEKFENPTAELAVIPGHIERIYGEILKKGIKNVILPKPVTSNFDTYKQMVKDTKNNNAKTLIASNWHYSDITKLTKALLDNLKGKKNNDININEKYKEEINSIKDKFNHNFQVQKAEIEYSKKNEVLTIDPPSQEMPHALQIIHSTGLMDLDDASIVMGRDEQSKSAVNATLFDSKENVKYWIEINSDLQKGDKTNLDRERVLKIYLDDEDKEADIICDYDAKFKDSKCIKNASVSVDITKNGETVAWKKEIIEDNMDKMYESMFNYIQGEENDALTLEEYEPVAKKISQIQSVWERLI